MGCKDWGAKAKKNRKVANDQKAGYKKDSSLWGTTRFANLWHPIGHPVSVIQTVMLTRSPLPSMTIQLLRPISYAPGRLGKQLAAVCGNFKASARSCQRR